MAATDDDSAPDPFDYPSDLLAGQEELHQIRADLVALLKRLPWSVEPLDAISDTQGWRKLERPASPGWSEDEQAEIEKLRQRERELAVFVTCHRHWAALSGTDAVRARARLKHVHATRPAGGAHEEDPRI
ncbi:hypothetical protein [Streptomyces longispororuber]|uniref:hypothetical protein n=1 Tax=Streptomyces longispororuber TaxID=68230 RepID=UPI0021089E0B|nr:hypothetical protein [Streptomyces longispororuber]MCQ4213853.1 hypothetical protein [Streptomyces longispororuber]